jgi:hypothetical protein
MSDPTPLRNRVAHFSANQAEVVQQFAQQHEAVLRESSALREKR